MAKPEVVVTDKRPLPRHPGSLCDVCDKSFCSKFAMERHKRKIHGSKLKVEKNTKCLEEDCTFTCGTVSQLIQHLETEHSIGMEYEAVSFNSVQEFKEWKDEIERERICYYVKKSGRKRHGTSFLSYFYCNRCGKHRSKGQGLRQPKKTVKTGVHCTANIVLIEADDGSIRVKICKTHYGHEAEPEYIKLLEYKRKSEKKKRNEELECKRGNALTLLNSLSKLIENSENNEFLDSVFQELNELTQKATIPQRSLAGAPMVNPPPPVVNNSLQTRPNMDLAYPFIIHNPQANQYINCSGVQKIIAPKGANIIYVVKQETIVS